jgi:hypothetical protein
VSTAVAISARRLNRVPGGVIGRFMGWQDETPA